MARLSQIKRPKEVPRNLFPGAFFCTHFQRNWPDFGVFPLIPAPFGIFPVGGGGIGGTPKMVGETTVLCGTPTHIDVGPHKSATSSRIKRPKEVPRNSFPRGLFWLSIFIKTARIWWVPIEFLVGFLLNSIRKKGGGGGTHTRKKVGQMFFLNGPKSICVSAHARRSHFSFCLEEISPPPIFARIWPW